MNTSIYFWIVFNVIIITILFLDLKFVHRQAHVVTIKEALGWSIFWIGLAIGSYFFSKWFVWNS